MAVDAVVGIGAAWAPAACCQKTHSATAVDRLFDELGDGAPAVGAWG